MSFAYFVKKLLVTNGQRIFMRGCITGAQIFYGEKLMSYQPVGSNALGCNSRTNAIIDFLLHTLQQ